MSDTPTEHFCYKADFNSKVGQNMLKFWKAAKDAATAADRFARSCGAQSYVQPVQYFDGGVEYLEFAKEPDKRLFRKALTDKDGVDEYEPNCRYRREYLELPDEHFNPSDKWNMVFAKEIKVARGDRHPSVVIRPWADVRTQMPVTYWAKMAGIRLKGDKDKDVKALNEKFDGHYFAEYIYYYADPQTDYSCDSSRKPHRKQRKCVAPWYLRKAVHLERIRQGLPSVEVEWLFAILGMKDAVEDAQQGARPSVAKETPTFFFFEDTVFVCATRPCNADGLVAVIPAVYQKKLQEALAAQSSMADRG